jgi:predicted RNA-binding protein with PIN domain
MRWLVDGMNVIGSRPDGWWRDRDGAVRRLAGELAAYARATGEPVAVVFDGRPVDVDPAVAEVVDASWAGAGRDAADWLIAERVESDPAPETIRVVTSDGALVARVRAAGAEVVSAGRFRRRLDGS